MTDQHADRPSADRNTGARPVTGAELSGINRAERNLRVNILALREGGAARRRDLRFRIVPFDAWQLANGGAIVASAVAFSTLVLDGSADAWRRGLPEPVEAGFEVLTRLGNSDWILAGTALFLLWAVARDATALGLRPRGAHWARAAVAIYLFLTVAASGIIAVLLKYAIGRARPRLFDEFGPYSFQVMALDPDWASFPSGHATTAMALAAALALLLPRLRPALLCAGLWIAFSRIVTGSHYPSDILAGCLLGGATAWLMARAFAQRRVVFAFDRAGALLPRLTTVRAISWRGLRSDPSQ